MPHTRARKLMPAAIRSTLRAWVEGVGEALGRDLVGVYILGSAVTSDFEPASSDIDFLIVTTRAISRRQTKQLATLHQRLARETRWGGRLEGSYAPRGRLRPWGILGKVTSVEGNGVRLDARSDWTAENMMALQQMCHVLCGPDPTSIFPLVDAQTLEQALHTYLRELMQLRPRQPEEASATILNLVRSLYGLSVKRPCVKAEAAVWFARTVPDLRPVLTAALMVRSGRARAQEKRLVVAGVPKVRKRVAIYLARGRGMNRACLERSSRSTH